MRPLLLALAGLALLPAARCFSAGPRRFDPDDRAEIARTLRGLTFPLRREEFWRRLPFPRAEFHPGTSGLVTGTVWERIPLDDDVFLNLRTHLDGRPDVEEWIDGAGIVVIPGQPWRK